MSSVQPVSSVKQVNTEIDKVAKGLSEISFTSINSLNSMCDNNKSVSSDSQATDCMESHQHDNTYSSGLTELVEFNGVTYMIKAPFFVTRGVVLGASVDVEVTTSDFFENSSLLCTFNSLSELNFAPTRFIREVSDFMGKDALQREKSSYDSEQGRGYQSLYQEKSIPVKLTAVEKNILTGFLSRQRYGLDILDSFNPMRCMSMAFISLYSALKRLDKQSRITWSDWNGAYRKYYKVTGLGTRALKYIAVPFTTLRSEKMKLIMRILPRLPSRTWQVT